MPRKQKRKPQVTEVTPEKKRRFCDVIRVTGNISYACAQIRVSRKTMYKHRNQNPAFAEQWDEAYSAGIEMLEQEARRRAFSGVKRVDVSYDKAGNITHRKVVTDYSDTLLIFMLKAAKPNKYRDVIRVENIDVSQLSDEQLEAIAAGTVPSGVRTPAPTSGEGFVN